MLADCKPYYYTGKNAKVKEVFAFFPVFAGERHLIRLTDRGAGEARQLSTPIFFLVSTKKKTAVEPSKEKTPVAAQLRAQSALPRSGTRP